MQEKDEDASVKKLYYVWLEKVRVKTYHATGTTYYQII